MSIEDRWFEKYCDDPKAKRRSSAQVKLERLEEELLENGVTSELVEQINLARKAVKEEAVRREDRLYGRVPKEEPTAPKAPDLDMAYRIMHDPEINAIIQAVDGMARKAYRSRQNQGTIMSEEDFVQEARVLLLERLHADARGGLKIEGPALYTARIKEDLGVWQKEDKWAQKGRVPNFGPNPEPGDPYTAEELRWALEDLHNKDNWHDPAILGAIQKIQHPAYREILEQYFTRKKPVGVSDATASKARTMLLFEVNMEAPLDRQGCCPTESRIANGGHCVCYGDGPGTRQVMTNHAAYWALEGELSFEDWGHVND